MAGRPLRPATRQRLGGPSPRQQADRTRPHPMPQKHFPPHHAMERSIRYYHPFPGAIPVHRAGWSRITHPFATLTTKQSLMDPVRLACVKHAASVHPEPESNPPQKTLQKAKNDSQIHFKRNQTDPLIRKGSHTKNLRHPSKPDRITNTKPCRRTTELAS